MFTDLAQNIILGKGELMYAPIVSGVRQPYFHMGNCARFAVIFNDDNISINDSTDAAAGVLKRVTRSREVAIEIGSNEYGIENLALAMMGDQSTFTQTSSAITGEVLTSSVMAGRFLKTAGRNISGVVITQGTVTWTPTTGYTVYDSSAGIIKVISPAAGGVTTATPCTAAYTRASLSLDMVLPATRNKVEGSLLFIPDPTTGPQYDVEIWKCAAVPAGDLDFIGDNFGDYQMNMTALRDAEGLFGGSASSPYGRLILRGVV
jgi:hypothetical protein